MDKYKKVIYGECMFRIEEEFDSLENAKNEIAFFFAASEIIE
jgi:hypothetical protein